VALAILNAARAPVQSQVAGGCPILAVFGKGGVSMIACRLAGRLAERFAFHRGSRRAPCHVPRAPLTYSECINLSQVGFIPPPLRLMHG